MVVIHTVVVVNVQRLDPLSEGADIGALILAQQIQICPFLSQIQ